MKRTGKLVTMAFGTLMLVSLAACGSNSGGSSTAQTQTDHAETTAAADTEQTAAASEQTAAAENVSIEYEAAGSIYPEVNIGLAGDPEKMSPFQTNTYGRYVNQQLYENLFYMISENGDQVLYPYIAKSYEMIDDTHCRVEIFDYVKDSEGNAITAEDIVYCSNLARDYLENNCTILEEATAVDDYTVDFTFTRELALGELQNFLRYVSIFDKDAYEASGNEFATAPITTAAYKLVEYTPGYSITLEVNDNYWQTDEQYRLKYSGQNVQTIHYYIITENAQTSMALQSGTIDLAVGVSYADAPKFEDGGQYADQFDVDYILDNLFWLIEPNCDASSVCSDQKVRQAICYAINNAAIAQAISGGNAEICYTMGNTKASDYNYDWQTQTGTIYDYNPEYAKQLLEEAGYSKGLTVRLLTRSGETYENIAVMLQGYLAEVGISLDINSLDKFVVDDQKTDPTTWDLYLSNYTNNDYMTKGWGFVFNPERYSWGLTENFIDDDHLQELLVTARSVDTHSAETVNAMNDYVNEMAYGYGLISEKNTEVYSVKITNVVWDPVGQFVLPGAFSYAD